MRIGLSLGLHHPTAGAATWSPTNASVGVKAWYRADLGRTDSGGLVSALLDQSGLGDANRNQSAAGALRPGISSADSDFGGKDCLTFTGTQYMSAAGAFSATIAPPFTIVFAAKVTADSSIYAEATNNTMLFTSVGFQYGYSTATGSLQLTSSAIYPGPKLVMVTDDGLASGTSTKTYVTDLTTAAKTSQFVLTPNIPRINLGFGVAGVSPLIGKLAEFIVFGGLLSVTDKSNLKDYLNITRAYGLGVTT